MVKIEPILLFECVFERFWGWTRPFLEELGEVSWIFKTKGIRQFRAFYIRIDEVSFGLKDDEIVDDMFGRFVNDFFANNVEVFVGDTEAICVKLYVALGGVIFFQ